MINRRNFLKGLGASLLGATILGRLLDEETSVKNKVTKLRAVYTPDIAQDREALYKMGYKGHQYLEAGYVYAPYIPLQMTKLNG